VIHEFAHQLDMLNGSAADGVPPMKSKEHAARWIETMDTAFARLVHDCQYRKPTVIDCYGTTNKAELFAVASEAFFQLPRQLASENTALYSALGEFYQQDPLRWT
jgi:Mlc titration factor MtfA (ptsG expression regulator)